MGRAHGPEDEQRPGPGPVRRRRNERKATVVLLVRHGRTPTTGKVLPGPGPGAAPLREGRAQAERAAERIAELSPQRRPPSTPRRSSGPARRPRPSPARCGLRVRTDSGLLDCEFGEWKGKSLRLLARKPEWRTVAGWPTGFRFPGGESFVEMQARVLDNVLDLAEAPPRASASSCVSHADPIKALSAATAGVPLDLFQRHHGLAGLGLRRAGLGPGRPTVLCVNTTGSLGELVPS